MPRFRSLVFSVLLLTVAFSASTQQSAATGQVPVTTALRFGSDISQSCDKPRGSPESAALAAWAASFAIKSVVGFAVSALEQATKPEKMLRHANAHGYLYRLSDDGKQWEPNGTMCIRFWYANLAPATTNTTPEQYAVDPTLATRWNRLSFIDQPYLYGEALISIDAKSNLVSVHPTLMFARRMPEASSFWRKSGPITLAVDLAAIGADKAFLTHLIEFPDVGGGPVLMRGDTLRGASSALVASPPPPRDVPAKPSAEGGDSAGPFNATVALTSESAATLWANAAAGAFKDEKQKLVEALTPPSSSARAQQVETATVAVFDAINSVLDAERNLATNEDKSKTEGLRNQVQKAKYQADLKLRAAGLPPRYGISAP